MALVQDCQVDAWFDVLPSALAQLQAGRARVIAIGSSRRVAALPDVPTKSDRLPGLAAGPYKRFAEDHRPQAAQSGAMRERHRWLWHRERGTAGFGTGSAAPLALAPDARHPAPISRRAAGVAAGIPATLLHQPWRSTVEPLLHQDQRHGEHKKEHPTSSIPGQG